MHLQWERLRNTICQSIDVETKQIQNETTYFQTNKKKLAEIQSMIYLITGITIVEDLKKNVTFFVTTVIDL